MLLPSPPLEGRFTRRQIVDATGIGDVMVAYWMTQGLLKATEGEGQRKGKYRYYGFEAIHIAVILREMRRYGLTPVGLKTLASMLWNVFELGQRFPEITGPLRTDASSLHRAAKLLSRQASLASDQTQLKFEHASIEEWLAHQPAIDHRTVEVAPVSEQPTHLAAALYIDLFTAAILEKSDRKWICTYVGEQLLIVPEDMISRSFDRDKLPSCIIINLSQLIRPIWMT